MPISSKLQAFLYSLISFVILQLSSLNVPNGTTQALVVAAIIFVLKEIEQSNTNPSPSPVPQPQPPQLPANVPEGSVLVTADNVAYDPDAAGNAIPRTKLGNYVFDEGNGWYDIYTSTGSFDLKTRLNPLKV